MLLLLFLCLLSILIHEKTKVLREENENLSHIRKRETILSKKENIELRASDKAKEESIPNTATKKFNRTHELESGTNKLRTRPTESSTGPSNKAFKNIPGDKTQGMYHTLKTAWLCSSESQQEQRNHFEQLRRYDGSAFSCYLRHIHLNLPWSIGWVGLSFFVRPAMVTLTLSSTISYLQLHKFDHIFLLQIFSPFSFSVVLLLHKKK